MRKLSLDIRQRRDEGFTLIELLVVVVILGILIAIAVPVYLNYRRSANDNAAQSDLRNAISTLEVCNSDGGYPQTPAGVPARGGTLGGCTQTIPVSAGTTFKYAPTPATGIPTSYIIYSTNSGGAGRYYCYNSQNGGSVRFVNAADAGAAATAMGSATTCPTT